MKKITFGLIVGICLVNLVSAISIDVEINIQDSFSLRDTVIFDYSIVSDSSVNLFYMDYIDCPNAPRAFIEQKNAFLNANEYLRGIHEDLIIDELILPQICTAIVQILTPIQKIESKTFMINISLPFSLDLLICKDSSCTEKSKVFIQGETIYLDYSSDVENPEVSATLIYPDEKTESITFPYSFEAQQIGTYELEVIASKEGYKTITKKEQFGVIETSADIQGGVIDDSKGELGKIDVIKIIKYLVYFLVLIFVILIFYLLLGRKRKRKY